MNSYAAKLEWSINRNFLVCRALKDIYMCGAEKLNVGERVVHLPIQVGRRVAHAKCSQYYILGKGIDSVK